MTIRVNLGSNGATVDGRIVGANVFFDRNFNLIQDPGELSAVVDGDGFFSFDTSLLTNYDVNGNGTLDPSEGQVVSLGGIDRSTGLPMLTVLRAPGTGLLAQRPVIVSPLSTLASHLLDLGLTYPEALDTLSGGLRLAGIGGDDLLPSIPYDELVTTPAGWDAFTEGVRIQNTVLQMASILAGADSALALAEAAEGVFREIALILLGGSGFDPGDADQAADLARAAALRAGVPLSAERAGRAGRVIGAGNSLIEGLERSSDTSAANAVVAIQGVSQSTVSDALALWAAGGLDGADLETRYTGGALQTLVDGATYPGFSESDLLVEVDPVTVSTNDEGVQTFIQRYEASNPVDPEAFGLSTGEVFEVSVDPLAAFNDTGVRVREVVIENYLDEGGPQQYLIYSSAEGFRTPVARVNTLPGEQTYTVPVAVDASGPVTLWVLAANRADPDGAAIIQRVTLSGLVGYVPPPFVPPVFPIASGTSDFDSGSVPTPDPLPGYVISGLFEDGLEWLRGWTGAEREVLPVDIGEAREPVPVAMVRPVVRSDYFETESIRTVMTEVDPLDVSGDF